MNHIVVERNFDPLQQKLFQQHTRKAFNRYVCMYVCTSVTNRVSDDTSDKNLHPYVGNHVQTYHFGMEV